MIKQYNLVLIGFMASGKTTIGRMCAKTLGYHFRDSDSLIERRTGKTIKEIFDQDGEEAFRAIETLAIKDLSRSTRAVIATGGGVPLNGGNIARLRRTGIVVLLSASVTEILKRVGDRKSRPVIAGADDPAGRIQDLLNEREPYYLSAAHVVVETSGLEKQDAMELVLDAYRSECAKRVGLRRLHRPRKYGVHIGDSDIKDSMAVNAEQEKTI